MEICKRTHARSCQITSSNMVQCNKSNEQELFAMSLLCCRCCQCCQCADSLVRPLLLTRWLKSRHKPHAHAAIIAAHSHHLAIIYILTSTYSYIGTMKTLGILARSSLAPKEPRGCRVRPFVSHSKSNKSNPKDFRLKHQQ